MSNITASQSPAPTCPACPTPTSPTSPVSAPSAKDSKSGLYSLLFFLLLEAMDTRQQTIFIQAKELSNNADEQEIQNRVDASLPFYNIPAGAGNPTIDQINNKNQAIANQRELIQNMLITLRQKSQVLMTETNTNVNTLEQDASMDSAWMKTLQAIFQTINQISQG